LVRRIAPAGFLSPSAEGIDAFSAMPPLLDDSGQSVTIGCLSSAAGPSGEESL
jgi:hypothetical protein